MSLGALVIGLGVLISSDMSSALVNDLLVLLLVGLLLETAGHIAHARDLKKGVGEGAASWHQQVTLFGWPYMISNGLLAVSILTTIWLLALPTSIILWCTLVMALLSTAVIRRSLFFALVIPTTMPGAFFWKNKGFEQHAKDTGLAKMQQVGVAYEAHRTFNIKELLLTIKETSMKEAVDQVKSIFIWKEVK